MSKSKLPIVIKTTWTDDDTKKTIASGFYIEAEQLKSLIKANCGHESPEHLLDMIDDLVVQKLKH